MSDSSSLDPNEVTWVCEHSIFNEMVELGIQLQEKVIFLEQDIKHFDKKMEITQDFYQAKLDKWYRHWYITIPLGVLFGGISTLTAYMILK